MPLKFIFLFYLCSRQGSETIKLFLPRADLDLDLLIALAAKTWPMAGASAARCHKMTLSPTKRQRLSSPHNRIGLALLYHAHSPRVLLIQCGWKPGTPSSLSYNRQRHYLLQVLWTLFICLYYYSEPQGFCFWDGIIDNLHRYSRCRVLYCFVLSTGSRCDSRMSFTISYWHC